LVRRVVSGEDEHAEHNRQSSRSPCSWCS
jgi:hypothetical protein